MQDDSIVPFDEEGNAGRDWKGLCTAIAAISFICALIISAIFILAPPSSDFEVIGEWQTERKRVVEAIESAWWRNNSTLIYTVRGGATSFLHLNSGETERVLESPVDPLSFLFGGPVRTKVSFDANFSALLRYPEDKASDPDNVVFTVQIISRNGSTWEVGMGAESSPLTLFAWAPSSHAFVFVFSSHLFFCSLPGEKAIRVSQKDDSSHAIFDWMTNEEIFHTKEAVWFSLSQSKLAFASRADNSLSTVAITTYHKGKAYDTVKPLAYPKVGEKRLPSYCLSLWETTSRQLISLDVQLRDSTSFHYLLAVSWVVLFEEEVLVATWANRWQNVTSITACRFQSATCTLIFEYKYKRGEWADSLSYSSLAFSNSSLFVILPHANSFQQVAQISISKSYRFSETKLSFVSGGEFDVTSIVGYDKKKETVYYLARAPLPRNSHVFSSRVHLTWTPGTDNSRCVSCLLPNCTFQSSALLSPDAASLFVSCNGPEYPFSFVMQLQDDLSPDSIILMRAKKLASLKLPFTVTYETISLSSSFEAIIKLYLPHDRTDLIPLLLLVYGGPGSQMATERVAGLHNEVLSSKYALALMDVRGSGGRGWKYRSAIYGALGTLEVDDHISALDQLLIRHSLLDRSRVTVLGWSYGGFLAANLVEKAPPRLIRCAVVVAPVSNFLFYDAAYTERYMSDAPLSAYSRHDLTRNVQPFNETRLLLIHGLRDDNVHFQNSAVLIQELQRQMIDFDLMVYPNEQHNIEGRRAHVFHKIHSFISKCFD